MSVGKRAGITVVVTGRQPATFIDDVFTQDRRTLAPEASETLPSAAATEHEEEKVWRPEPLPLRRPEGLRVTDLTAEKQQALEYLRAGKTVTIRHAAREPLSLSRVSDLAQVARSTDGHLVIELGENG